MRQALRHKVRARLFQVGLDDGNPETRLTAERRERERGGKRERERERKRERGRERERKRERVGVFHNSWETDLPVKAERQVGSLS